MYCIFCGAASRILLQLLPPNLEPSTPILFLSLVALSFSPQRWQTNVPKSEPFLDKIPTYCWRLLPISFRGFLQHSHQVCYRICCRRPRTKNHSKGPPRRLRRNASQLADLEEWSNCDWSHCARESAPSVTMFDM
jgi:hypothetical protein